MFSTAFAPAPTGVLGWGSADVRPYACAAVRPSLLPPVAVVDGTRVPGAGMARRRRERDIAGFGVPAFGAIALLTVDQHDPISTNHGTTPLGIHPRGRSTS
jgi:hypothetical protein